MIKVDIVSCVDGEIEITFMGSLSVNRLYRNAKGRNKPYIQAKSIVYNYLDKKYTEVLSRKYNNYEKYYCKYIFVFNNKRSRDVSNYIKFFEDVLFRLIIKDDDSKVFCIEIEKRSYSGLKSNYLIIQWGEYKQKEISEDNTLLEKIQKITYEQNKPKQKQENKKSRKSKKSAVQGQNN